MKSLKSYFFTTLFIIFVIPFIYSFPVSAAAAPDLSQHTYELIDNGTELIFQTMGTEHGIFNIFGNYTDIIHDFLGLDPSLKPSDYSIRPLSEIERVNIEEGFTSHFYDSEGNEIDLNNLYYVSGDNGYFQAEFYIDSEGNILYDSPSDPHTLLNLQINPLIPLVGVTGQNYASWGDVYTDLVGRITSNNFNYSAPDVDLIDNSYFLWVPYGNSAAYVYIANQYNPGITVPVTSTNGATIQRWYTNDLSTIVFANTKGDVSSQLIVSVGSWTKLGHTYKYLVSFMPYSGYDSIRLGSYETWLSQGGNIIFGREGYWYDGNRYKTSVPFIRTKESELPLINPDEWYSYDELSLINDIPEEAPETNPYYNPSSPIDPDNYPFEYPTPDNPLVPSDLPLIGSNPALDPSPDISDDPILDIDPESPLPLNIPFLEGLSNRFPFCIPWEFKRWVNSFKSSPSAPAWDFDYSITVAGRTYTTHFTGDLSDFDDLAFIFRQLIFIGFVIWLLFASYKYFF